MPKDITSNMLKELLVDSLHKEVYVEFWSRKKIGTFGANQLPEHPDKGLARYNEFIRSTDGCQHFRDELVEEFKSHSTTDDPDSQMNMPDEYIELLAESAPEGFSSPAILMSLSGGNSGAVADLVKWLYKGAYIQSVVKKDLTSKIEVEKANMAFAQSQIAPQACPNILFKSAVPGGESVLVTQVSTNETLPLSFTDFCDSAVDDQIRQGLSSLNRLFIQKIGTSSKPDNISAQELLGFADNLRATSQEKHPYSKSILEGLASLIAAGELNSINGKLVHAKLDMPIPNGINSVELKLSEIRIPVTRAHPCHGDLNPRNILILNGDEDPQPLVIDFDRFGEAEPDDPSKFGSLALDIARLEAGLLLGEGTSETGSAVDPKNFLDHIKISKNSGEHLDSKECKAHGGRWLAIQLLRGYLKDAVPTADHREYSICLGLHLLSYARSNYLKMLGTESQSLALLGGSALLTSA